MRRPLLTDETVELRLQQHEKLRYRTMFQEGVIGHWQAEIIGPFDSRFVGRSAFGSDKEKAVNNLIGQLRRNGFIGRLVEDPIRGPISNESTGSHVPVNIGRMPDNTFSLSAEEQDLLDHVFSDDDLLADDYVTGLD